MRVVGPALRSEIKRLLPMAHAFDLCVTVKGSDVSGPNPFLSSLLAADHALGLWADSDYDEVDFERLPSESAIEAATMAASMRVLTSERVLAKLDEIETPLIRKIQGAREVIGVSSDGVSQAANSMIELVDRLFRTTFPDSEVLAWIDQFIDPQSQGDLTHQRDGKILPTFKARALCFICAGQNPGDSLGLYLPIAAAFTWARNELQNLKHADMSGAATPKELLDAVGVVEAALEVVFRFAWLALDDEVRDPLLRALREAA